MRKRKLGKAGIRYETRGRKPATIKTPLTRKQELFVRELVSKDGQITMREAAENAGYSATSAHTRAYELTNQHISPHVVHAIKEYRRAWMRSMVLRFIVMCVIFSLFVIRR